MPPSSIPYPGTARTESMTGPSTISRALAAGGGAPSAVTRAVRNPLTGAVGLVGHDTPPESPHPHVRATAKSMAQCERRTLRGLRRGAREAPPPVAGLPPLRLRRARRLSARTTDVGVERLSPGAELTADAPVHPGKEVPEVIAPVPVPQAIQDSPRLDAQVAGPRQVHGHAFHGNAGELGHVRRMAGRGPGNRETFAPAKKARGLRARSSVPHKTGLLSRLCGTV